MESKQFLEIAIQTVCDYGNQYMDETEDIQIKPKDIYIVWYCKTLQNHKALLSTVFSDGMYYECTYNGDKQELYLDAYKKWENVKVAL